MEQKEPDPTEDFEDSNEQNEESEDFQDGEEGYETGQFHDGLWPLEIYQKFRASSFPDFIVLDESTQQKRERKKQFEGWYSRLGVIQKMMLEGDGYFPFRNHPGKYGWDVGVDDQNSILEQLLFSIKQYKHHIFHIGHCQIFFPFQRMESVVFLQLKQLIVEGVQVQSIQFFSFLNAPLLEAIDLRKNFISNISAIRKWDFKIKEVRFQNCPTFQHQNIFHLCSSQGQKGLAICLGSREQFATTFVKTKLTKKILYELLMKFTTDPLIAQQIGEDDYSDYEDIQHYISGRKRYKRLISSQSKVVKKLFALSLEK